MDNNANIFKIMMIKMKINDYNQEFQPENKKNKESAF
jgi:hypothetical protein